MKDISPLAPDPWKHLSEANRLVVDMAEVGMETLELMERLYFLTEGWKEKDHRSASQRMRAILEQHQ